MLGCLRYLPRSHILEAGEYSFQQLLIALATNTNPDILCRTQALTQKFSVGCRTSLRLSGHETGLLDTLNLANPGMDLKTGISREKVSSPPPFPNLAHRGGVLVGEDSLNFMIFPGPATGMYTRNGKGPADVKVQTQRQVS